MDVEERKGNDEAIKSAEPELRNGSATPDETDDSGNIHENGMPKHEEDVEISKESDECLRKQSNHVENFAGNKPAVAKEGAIHSLADRNTNLSAVRRSWSSFTSNISSSSVAESVHAHRQQFLVRRAKFNQGAAEAATPDPAARPANKKFEIELRALKLGERKKVLDNDSSWQKHKSEKEETRTQPAFEFRRQGSVRDRVQRYTQLASMSQLSSSRKSLQQEEPPREEES
ncbi:uncharacterized protein LOC135941268 isoform X1 [Cloeon dipterum]|uniref:uncharacterized protein LOC135941268 isoform X1 n=1 Tax=Cloeon dipterum TaxID=197152 RepID=UPI0032202CE6